MKGYIVNSGYMGYIPDKGYSLFSTQKEYEEYYKEYYGEKWLWQHKQKIKKSEQTLQK